MCIRDSIRSMKPRVLILEDEFYIAEDLERILVKLDVEVEKSYNYEEAIECAIQFSPDVIISDINLDGEKTGIDAVRKIREQLNPKVIYLTSYSDKKYTTDAYEVGMDMYIVKPYNDEQFKASVQIILNELHLEKREQEELNLDSLSKTEKLIIQLIAKNNTTKEIADQLSVSTKTIEKHRSNISFKLDIPVQKNSLLQWVLKNKAIIEQT